MKKHLAAADPQPATLTELQALIDAFTAEYNERRPTGRSHTAPPPPRSTPPGPKPPPGDLPATAPGRVHIDTIDKAGSVTLRHNGKLHHIGIGRIHEGTRVLLIVEGLHIRVLDAATGETLRELTLDPTRDYQPTGQPQGPTRPA